MWGRSLRHPLVYMVPLLAPGDANRVLAQKQASLDEAIADGDRMRIVLLHERAYRLDALIEYVTGRDEHGDPLPLSSTDDAVRDLAEYVWTDSENINQYLDAWAALFSGPGFLLGDRNEWQALPETVTIYRAGIDDGGWSWTTDRAVAEFFAQRFREPGDELPVMRATCRRDDMFGYITRRSESEVLIRPEHVQDDPA